MAEGLYKLVFKGEIGFDYDEAEVKDNLRRQCGFDERTVERLFSGGSYILKKDLELAAANKYREVLQRLGALCEIQPMVAPPPVVPEPPPSTAEPSFSAPAAGRPNFQCPACGRPQEKGESCVACGIIFAKHERAQLRRQELDDENSLPPGMKSGPVRGARSAVTPQPELQEWLLPCCATLVSLAVLQLLLKRELMVLGVLLLPFAFLVYLLIRSLMVNRGMMELLQDEVEWETTALAPGDRDWRRLPWLTWLLVVVEILLYYLLVIRLAPDQLAADFTFLPVEGGVGQTVLSLFSAMFLHADGWQLWGSAVFLWIVGSLIESRFGQARLLLFYVTFGLLAFLVAAGAHHMLLGESLHAVGSSGAIAGMLGLIVAAERGKLLAFSPPLLGWITLALSTGATIRLAAPLLVGLFFYANLSYLTSYPDQEFLALLVGHLAHLAAFLVGVLGGLLFVSPEPASTGVPSASDNRGKSLPVEMKNGASR